MKRTLALAMFASLLTLCAASAQPWQRDRPIIDVREMASSPQITRTLAWNGRDALEIEVPAEVTYVRGPTARVDVTGPEVLVRHVSIEAGEIGFRASLRCNSYCSMDTLPLRVAITAPALDSLTLGLGARAQALNVRQPAFSLKLNTGAHADLIAEVETLTLQVNSGGHLEASGRARHTRLDVGSGAGADLARLAVDEAVVHASSASTATFTARRSAEVQASSVAKVRLLNRPPQLSVRASSMADVRVDDE